ncbi:MAG: DUF3617 domain-containing protein [Sphingomonas sp.]|jgi:hypothetical protein|uniref:DUF3617 domain-containing protein n=1 Tax=Sphingomonas sp. TaxID=28214 RepID=UPI00356369B2
MRAHILLAGAAMSLAACSQPAPTANGSTATTTTTANATTPIAPVPVKNVPRVPGEWEYVTKVEMLGVQGAPAPGIGERMKAGPQIDTRRACMSKEEAEEDIAKAVQKDQGGCRFERVQASAGTLAGTAICSNGGMEATGKMTGTIKPTAMDMVIDMTMKLPGAGTAPPSSLKMRMTMAGKRVGDCTQ